MAKIYSGLNGTQGVNPSTPVDPHFNHLVVGVTYYTDDTYTTTTTPLAGSISVEGRVNGNAGWSVLTDSPIDCTDTSASANTSIPLQEVRLVATALDAGVYYQATITANAH